MLDPNKKSALLRFSNDNARIGADELSANGVEYTYIPQTPIAEITTDTAWLYSAIAKYLIIEKYSAYDVISEIPVEGNETRKIVSNIKRMLSKIEQAIIDENAFYSAVDDLDVYLVYETRTDHLKKLYQTFEAENLSKLIIVKLNNYNANCFQSNLAKILAKSNLGIDNVLIQK